MQVLVGFSLTVLSCCRIHPRMHSLLYTDNKAVFLIRAPIYKCQNDMQFLFLNPESLHERAGWVEVTEPSGSSGIVERGLDLGLGNHSVL